MGKGCPHLQLTKEGSVVSSFSRVRVGASATNAFSVSQNALGENKMQSILLFNMVTILTTTTLQRYAEIRQC